ncbi:tetratricopeptide repeat protein [Desulfogranum marinum]|uniref:tetratricopeptide repeat protein n=1 Tax=Desulfogranum marinum TaxID=453220 RepID=UPI0029C61CBD|nr:tetratricopeptide repeat protein [Desulfogranum marinum]
MKNIGFSPSILTLVTVSLLIGFLGGVVFTVYKSPSITSQLTGRGEQASNQIDWAEHISHLKKSIDENPNDAEVWSQLANAYFKAQDYKNSIQAYLKLIPLVEKKSGVYQDLGVVYRKDGQFEKSIDTFEKAITHDPDNLQALFNIGVVQFHDLEDESAAMKTWEKVASVKPDLQLATGQTIQQLLEAMKD